MSPKELPIGYWIKKVDELLTNGINEIHSAFGMKRTDWQVLNSIKQDDGSLNSELTEIMLPFTDKDTLERTLIGFKQTGLIKKQGPKWILTEKGQETHKNCFKKQKSFRERTMNGISDQEYQTTYSTLKKIVENLE